MSENNTNATSTIAVNGNGPNLYLSNNSNSNNFIGKVQEKEFTYHQIQTNLKKVKNRNTLKQIDNKIMRELHDIRRIISKPNEDADIFQSIMHKYIDLIMISSRLKKHLNYKFVPSTKTINRRGPNPYSKRKSTRKTRRK